MTPLNPQSPPEISATVFVSMVAVSGIPATMNETIPDMVPAMPIISGIVRGCFA